MRAMGNVNPCRLLDLRYLDTENVSEEPEQELLPSSTEVSSNRNAPAVDLPPAGQR